MSIWDPLPFQWWHFDFREGPMPLVELLTPDGYRRFPWKNGRGELVVIDREGSESWEDMGVAWHFGRTAIVEEGPVSDYTGYERLQVVIRGAGLVLVGPDCEIDLRVPMRAQRYDGATPIRTVLEQGAVEVVNLIADRARFAIDLRMGDTGAEMPCRTGRHVVYAPVGAARLDIGGRTFSLAEDYALRVRTSSETTITLQSGRVLLGSIHDRH
jgi:environmental stress-induced protein Ves